MNTTSALTDLEQAVVQVLLKQTDLTVRQVHEALGSKGAYTVVLTTMKSMEQKGLIKVNKSYMTYVYSVAEPTEAPKRGLFSALFERLFTGAARELVVLISFLGIIAAGALVRAQTQTPDGPRMTRTGVSLDNIPSINAVQIADNTTSTTTTPTPDKDSSPNASSATESAPTTNAAPSSASAIVTDVTPAPTPTPLAEVTPEASKAAPAVIAAVVPANQTIYYRDDFSRKGELDGSSPAVKNTGKNTWSVSTGPGTYSTNGKGVSDSGAAYDAAFLPVNGTSGITLDGTQNFTLSATVAPDTAGWIGISVTMAPITNGHNIFDNGLAEMTVANGNTTTYNQATIVKYLPFGDAITAPYAASITYHAKSGTITYTVGDTVVGTLPDVKPEQIAALTSVAMGNGNCGPTATFNNFTFSVGGAD